MAKGPRVRAPVLDAGEKKRRRYITAARSIYETKEGLMGVEPNDIEVDSDARISESEDGAWVQVFVYEEDLPAERRR